MRNANSPLSPKEHRDRCFRDVTAARRGFRLAAQRFGAVANAGGSRSAKFTDLAEAAEQAARELVKAEQRLAEADAALAAFSADNVQQEVG